MGANTFRSLRGLQSTAARHFARRVAAIGELRSNPGGGGGPPPPVEGRLYRMDWGGNVGNTTSGVAITPQTALTIGAYFACINRLSSDVGCHPFQVVETTPGKDRRVLRDHPIARAEWVPIRDARARSQGEPTDAISNRAKVMTAYIAGALSWGSGYLQAHLDGFGRVEAFELLDPSGTFGDYRSVDGALYYQSSGEALCAHEVLHLAGLGGDGLHGYSIARFAREPLGLAKAQEIYPGRFFASGGKPSGVLKTPKVMSRQAKENLRESWNAIHGGPAGAHNVAILEEGIEYQSISIPPDDAQYLQSRQFQLVEICRWFLMPPHKVGDYSQMQLASAGVEAANLDYLTSTVLPWVARIELEWTRKLLTEDERGRGIAIEFDLDWLLRADTKTRTEAIREGIAWGWRTRNEARQQDGLNPRPDCEDLIVPVNMTPLKNLLAAPPRTEPPARPATE